MVFGSRMIKPDLNRGRLVKTKEGRANKSGCKGMLNEAVLKCAAVSQRNAEREREREEKRKEIASL